MRLFLELLGSDLLLCVILGNLVVSFSGWMYYWECMENNFNDKYKWLTIRSFFSYELQSEKISAEKYHCVIHLRSTPITIFARVAVSICSTWMY